MMNSFAVRRPVIIKWVLLVGLFVFAFGMAACGDKTTSEKAKATGEAVGDAAKATGDAVGDAAKATGDAVGGAIETTDDYLTQSKDEDVKATRQKLDEIEKKWQDLLTRAKPATSEAKVDLQKAKDQMAVTLADAKAKLMEAKNASEDTWKQNVKPSLYEAMLKAKKLYEDTYTRFVGK